MNHYSLSLIDNSFSYQLAWPLSSSTDLFSRHVFQSSTASVTPDCGRNIWKDTLTLCTTLACGRYLSRSWNLACPHLYPSVRPFTTADFSFPRRDRKYHPSQQLLRLWPKSHCILRSILATVALREFVPGSPSGNDLYHALLPCQLFSITCSPWYLERSCVWVPASQ